jgi:hypothetical protein
MFKISVCWVITCSIVGSGDTTPQDGYMKYPLEINLLVINYSKSLIEIF